MTRTPRLLLRASDVAVRRAAASGPLAPLAASLAADLAVVEARDLFVPAEKARLTRVGGRCAVDGTLLAFDPFSPRVHRCARCGRVYDDEAHYRWWIMWYQQWLAERAVHGAALALLVDDAAAGALARRILEAYVDRYLTYPNRDNVLGPTRLFFSTYLESIWLLQLCVATDLLEARHDAGSLGAAVRDRIVEPSRALIASYDERTSNRQVWNAAALAAAARLLGDDEGLERAIHAPSGVASHLRTGLLGDGTWYEGENYHQFAHRGLWYGVTLAEHAGIDLPPESIDRFHAGFVAPFLTAFPDLTLPARRDSQWAVSLRQWRWAEWCELGLARTNDERLHAALRDLYESQDAPRRDTGRWRSTAESERNEPATSLGRADLGWKSLLHAPSSPAAPAVHHSAVHHSAVHHSAPHHSAVDHTAGSVLLEDQGLAVFRRNTLYAALDYGTSGGGHGHPDRLNLLLADGASRWLDDMGTGSYVERTLHWYRSTLAHDTPLVDGRSQDRVDGQLLAYDDRGPWSWALAAATIARGVDVRRAVVVARDYVVDRLTWRAAYDVALDLPLHIDGDTTLGPWRTDHAQGAGGLEDGFDFIEHVEASDAEADAIVRLDADGSRAIFASLDETPREHAPLRAWIHSPASTTWYRAVAPSSPGRDPRRFHFVRMRGLSGEIASVYDTRRAIDRVSLDGDAIVVVRNDGGVDEHRPSRETWHVRSSIGADGHEVRLAGASRPRTTPVAPTEAPARIISLRVGAPIRIELGEPHYRRSEQTWHEASRPRATVQLALAHVPDALHVDVAVVTPHPTFVPAGRDNPLDNERAEINGDSVQLYVRPYAPDGVPRDTLAWLLVPDDVTSSTVRTIALTPASTQHSIDARWSRTRDGYALHVSIAYESLDARELGFDLIVNETTPDRERRRGQLVLSGGGARGEFVYLQGDRHDPSRFLRLRLERGAHRSR